MGRLKVKFGDWRVKRLNAHIVETDREVDVTYSVTAGHYYLVRESQYGKDERLVVVRATDDHVMGRPMFIQAPDERTHLGPVEMLIIADLGTEEP